MIKCWNIYALPYFNDNVIQVLTAVIMKGWPETKNDVTLLITPYYNYRDKLTVQDGIVLRDERVVIPNSLRDEMLR